MISVTPAKIDLLTAALKAFERGRARTSRATGVNWDAWALAERATFAAVDGNALVKKSFDYDGFMSAHAGPGYKGHSLDEKRAVGSFLSHERKQPHDFGWYLGGRNRPQATAMTPAVLINLMMRLRPAEFPGYTQLIRNMMVFTGVVRTSRLPRLSLKVYEAEKQIQDVILARMFQLGIGQVAGDRNDPADYLTLAEFAGWLDSEDARTQAKNALVRTMPKPPPMFKGGVGALVFR